MKFKLALLALVFLSFSLVSHAQNPDDCTAIASCSACGGGGQCSVPNGTCHDGNCVVCTSCCDIGGNCTTVVCNKCVGPNAPSASTLSSRAKQLPCAPPLPASVELAAFHLAGHADQLQENSGRQLQQIETAQTGTGIELSNLNWVASMNRFEISGFSLSNGAMRSLAAYKVRFQIYSNGSAEPLEIQRTSDLTWVGSQAFLKSGEKVDVKLGAWVKPSGPISRVVTVVSYAEFDDGTRVGPEADSFSRTLNEDRQERLTIYKKVLTDYRQQGPEAATRLAAASSLSGKIASIAAQHLEAVYEANGAAGLLAELRRIAEPER